MGLYEGLCVGGPLDGKSGESRFPRGFVYADPVGGRVWVYDYHEGIDPIGNRFAAREVDQLDRHKLSKAADESSYDVRAYDDGEIPDDLEVGL